MILKNKNILLKNKKKIVNLSILSFAFFPIIPNFIKGLPVILLLIIAIFFYEKGKIEWKSLLNNSSLYLVYLFTLLYTNNFDYASNKLETCLSILLLPIIFFILLPEFKIKSSQRLIFSKIFIITTAIFSTLVFCFFIEDDSTIYYQDWYSNKFRIVVEKINLIGQHPIYASIFLAISIIFFIDLVMKRQLKSGLDIIFFTLISLINIILILFLLSKGIVIAVLLAILFLVINNPKLNRHKNFVVILFLIIVVSLFVFNRRMSELMLAETYNDVNKNYSTSIRVGIYKCTFHLIKEQFIFGYGLGDSQDVLENCFENKHELLIKGGYNTHNQYLDTILKAGIFGLIIFFYFIAANLVHAYKNKDQLALTVILFYVIAFLTENILARQSGVILFYFLLHFLNCYQNKSIIVIK